MKILYIVPYAPTPIRTRPYNLLRSLTRLGHQVTLATLWENQEEFAALQTLNQDGIQLICEPLTRLQIARNLAEALLKHKPLQSYYSWNRILAYKIAGYSDNHYQSCDIIHFEHLRGAVYGLFLKRLSEGQTNPTPLVWDSVDNISALFEQAAAQSKSGFGRWITRLELPLTRRYESDLRDQFSRLLVTSPADQAAFESLKPGRTLNPNIPTRIEVLTNGVDMETFTAPGGTRQPDQIVFTGKLSYHANLAAALFLAEKILPKVWEKRPQVRLQLVGKDPPALLLQLAQAEPRIEVTGTVPDLPRYLQQASLSAATLTYGAGVQNKVLEAMACGTPVVATSKAVSALQAVPGQDVLVADEPGELASQILRLLEDPALQQTIGENGRRYIQQNHNWDTIARKLVAIYENVLDASQPNKNLE